MAELSSDLLAAVINASTDAVLVVRTDRPEWPVQLANAAFTRLANDVALDGAFADVCEALFGRDAAVDVSEAIRRREATRFPVELGGRECVLSAEPIGGEDGGACAVFLRTTAGGVPGGDDAGMAEALLHAKRKIRDLDRDDPVTGLLNERAFRDVLAHDWAVAAREKSRLAVVRFIVVDFDAYLDVFGRHASDSCLRRVGQAIRRCLRRASDVVARLDDTSFVVLSHASDVDGIEQFARSIASAVRDLKVHHPRSTEDKYVTVHYNVIATEAGGQGTADEFLARLE